MNFEKWLAAKGIDNFDELSESVQKTLKASFEAEVAALEAAEEEEGRGRPENFDEIIAQRKADRDRRNAITKLVAGAIDDHPTKVDEIEALGLKAMEDKDCTPQSFELELLRSLRPTGPPNMRAANDDGMNARTIEAAVCQQLRLNDIEKHYDEKTLDAADKHFRHGIGMQELLLIAARQNGYRGHSIGNVREVLECAFPSRNIQAAAGGFSTFSLSGVLGNTLRKMLVDYFMHVDQAWREISAIRPVRDFKQVTSYSLTGDLQYKALGPDGEIKHGTLDAQSYTNQAETYARMLAITRTDIINDDLGAFQNVPKRLGRGAALKINDVFWTVFLNNSSFFAGGNNNVSTGGGSALGTADGAAINAAEVVFMNQTDPDGKPVGIMPKILLAPPTLLNTAARWMGGQNIVTGADTTLPSANVYQGRYRVVSSPYMENSSYTGYSAAAWYLLADPQDVPVIETCFLNGKDMPTIESADADFNVLGIQVRAYHDFGCALQEPRGGVRSAGS